MTTLIHPTIHDFTGNEAPNMIISTGEVKEMVLALKGDEPDIEARVIDLCQRQVPVHQITAEMLMGKVASTMPVFEPYEPIMAKYNHFLRMLGGIITTMEYDAICARIDAETAERAA